MTKLNNAQLHQIAEWCAERGMLSDRITGSDVWAACRALSIANDGDFDLYQIKSIGEMIETE